MEKITNVKALEMAIATLSVEGSDFPTEALEKLQNVMASYAKKSSSPKKPTQTQLDNEKIKDSIVSLLSAEPTRLFTVTEIAKTLGDYSNQKISALCTALKGDNLIVKVEDKRKSYYKAIA